MLLLTNGMGVRMSAKWIHLDCHITADDAENEPEHDRLFGLSYETRRAALAQRSGPSGIGPSYNPWAGKPYIQRGGGLGESTSRRRRKAATK